MAGRLDLKGRFDPEDNLGISRGYKQCPQHRLSCTEKQVDVVLISFNHLEIVAMHTERFMRDSMAWGFDTTLARDDAYSIECKNDPIETVCSQANRRSTSSNICGEISLLLFPLTTTTVAGCFSL